MKPLLASPADLDKIRFPLLGSVKIDGIRGLVVDGEAVSRKLKPIPNHHIRTLLSGPQYNGYDGEIVTYTNGVMDPFNTIQSKVMSMEGTPDFKFMVFDTFTNPDQFYLRRYFDIAPDVLIDRVPIVPLGSMSQMMAFEAAAVKDGWEGIMVRSMTSPYKFGRSTVNEGYLLKIKRFEDSEAEVIGFKERMTNLNEQVTDNLGYAKRSTSKENLVGANTLGAITLMWNGVVFDVGTGFDAVTAQYIWDNRDTYMGYTVTFKFQDVGPLGAPRFPVFLGFRYDLKE